MHRPTNAGRGERLRRTGHAALLGRAAQAEYCHGRPLEAYRLAGAAAATKSVSIRFPAWPASTSLACSSAPIAASPPVRRTKSEAAMTFGPIEPAAHVPSHAHAH